MRRAALVEVAQAEIFESVLGNTESQSVCVCCCAIRLLDHEESLNIGVRQARCNPLSDLDLALA